MAARSMDGQRKLDNCLDDLAGAPLEGSLFENVTQDLFPLIHKYWLAARASDKPSIKLNHEYKLVSTFGSDEMSLPRGLAIDKTGELYVANTNRHNILVFSADGIFIKKFGKQGQAPGQYYCPSAVTFTLDGNLLVLDKGNCRVQHLDRSENYINHFGSRGEGIGQFTSPFAFTLDNDGNCILSDSGNSRLQLWTIGGELLRIFGEGFVSHPIGIAVDCLGNIFSMDQTTNKVCIFGPDYEHIDSYGEPGTQEGQFKQPWGLFVDKQGLVIVSDGENERLQVFQKGEFLFQLSTRQPKDLGEVTASPLTAVVDVKGRIIVTKNGPFQALIFE